MKSPYRQIQERTVENARSAEPIRTYSIETIREWLERHHRGAISSKLESELEQVRKDLDG